METKTYTKPTESELREKLTKEQYEVTQNAATERPFINEYYRESRPGIYVDIVTGEPLFLSTEKFESKSGWPSFSRPIDPQCINEVQDLSHGLNRVEIRSAIGDSHLGHVFPDGPVQRGGKRYCVNSAALKFVPFDEMESEGYGEYIPLLTKK